MTSLRPAASLTCPEPSMTRRDPTVAASPHEGDESAAGPYEPPDTPDAACETVTIPPDSAATTGDAPLTDLTAAAATLPADSALASTSASFSFVTSAEMVASSMRMPSPAL